MKTLFNKKVAVDFYELITLIENLHEVQILKFKTDKDRPDEYFGYHRLSEDDEIFFGIWFDTWKMTGSPLVIAIQSQVRDQIKFKGEMKKYFSKNKACFGDYRIYNKFHCFSFSLDYLKKSKLEDVSRKIIDLTNIHFSLTSDIVWRR